MIQLTAENEKQIREELSKKDYELGERFRGSPRVFLGGVRGKVNEKRLMIIRNLDVEEDSKKFTQEMLTLIELKKNENFPVYSVHSSTFPIRP